MGDLSEHFDRSEFACHDLCGLDRAVDAELIRVLEELRAHFMVPIQIVSGLRCPRHNRAIGGVTDSQHLYGTAADIKVGDVDSKKIYSWLDERFPDSKGVGRYKTFTHFDVREKKARWEE